jgi:hypothetical protein
MQIQESLKTVSIIISLKERGRSSMHRCKPPVIKNEIPSENERYNLDDPEHLRLLGVSLKQYLPKADEYSHYPHCEYAIIEYKGNSLRNSIEQLEFTAKQLTSFQKKIDRAIIIAGKINKKEKNYFTKRGNILYRKKDDKPVLVPAGSSKIAVTLYSPVEIEKQYQDFGRSLDRWRY